MEDLKLHLVSHVHWDPMWYSSFEEYRIRLIKLIKKLLDILDSNGEYHSFMFDGQVSAIDDYLEIIPTDEKRIRNHIESGKLIIGPWYILPEEFMISGEAHIRNLMLGRKRGMELGGIMNISYLCDMVGHIPQMPQILRGFDIDTCVGWRGIMDGKKRIKTEFIWESPDGSQVLMKVMPNSYVNILPEDAEGFIQKIESIKQSLYPLATTPYLLIMQGGDHLEPIPSIPELIHEYNHRMGRKELEHTSLQNHIECVKSNVADLPVYVGEFRSLYRAPILTGILTTRMQIKLMNEALCTKLEKWVEPFCSIRAALGRDYPSELIEYTWKKQIKNAFHDCIYGAHVDKVTADIFNDYKRADEINSWLEQDALYGISQEIDTTGNDLNVTIFNPVPWERRDASVEFSIFLEENEVRFEFIAETPSGDIVPLQIQSVEREIKYSDLSGNMNQCGPRKEGYRYIFSARIPVLPALGYVNLNIRRYGFTMAHHTGEKQQYISIINNMKSQTDLKVLMNGCENAYIKLFIQDDGTLNLYDKTAGFWYKNMHVFEDSGDAGDNYNYSPPVQNKVITSKGQKARISLIENGLVRIVYRVELDLDLPCCVENNTARSSQTIKNPIQYDIILYSYSKLVEFKTIVQNCSKDHRLRLLFPTALSSSRAWSGSQFMVMKRPTGSQNLDTYWEIPMGNYPHRGFVDISDGTKGLAFLNRGLPEYYATPEGDLYITLLRATGYLSKGTLPHRSYSHAGPELATYMAQEIGSHVYEYSLYLHSGDCMEGKSYRRSEEFNASVKSAQGSEHSGSLPRMMSFLKVEEDGILLSAFKKGRGDNEWIIRMYNILNEDRQCTIKFFKSIKRACLTNLYEEFLEEIPVHGSNVSVDIKAHKLVTVSIEL